MNQNSITRDERLAAGGKRIGLAFLGLIGLQIIFDLPFLLNLAVPHNDTMHVFQWFAFFYNEIFWHNALPQWIPFGFYGIQSDYFPILLGPANYLAGLAGRLFHMGNMYTLFKASMLLEQLTLLYGTYLLAMELFRHRGTVYFVCISVIGSNFLLFQLFWNFRAFYLLPLIIFLLLRFLSSRRFLFLSLALGAFSMQLLGNMTYLVPANMLIVLWVFLVLLIGNYKNCLGRWRDFFRLSRADILWNALFLLFLALVLGSYFYMMKSLLVDTRFLAEGRDPHSGITDLNTFLTYAPNIGLGKFMRLMNPASYSNAEFDLAMYAGALALPFLVYGLIVRRSLAQFAFLTVVAVLGAISLGGSTPAAEFFYSYFPLMKYYRHIGYIVYSYHVFVPVLAGYGLDCALDRMAFHQGEEAPITPMRSRRLSYHYSEWILWIILGCCAVYVSCLYAKAILTCVNVIKGAVAPATDHMAQWTAIGMAILWLIPVFILYAYGKRAGGKNKILMPRLFTAGLLVVLCLDFFAYQGLSTLILYPQSRPVCRLVQSDLMKVSRYPFQVQRTTFPPHERAARFVSAPVLGVRYAIACNLMQWDPYAPVELIPHVEPNRIDMINSGVATFIEKKGGSFSTRPPVFPMGDAQRAMGGDADKLKIYTNVRLAGSPDEALAMIQNSQDLSVIPVIVEDGENALGNDKDSVASETAQPDIIICDYWANEIIIETLAPGDKPSWLYYAEAWHPDWRAYVNGRPTPVLRANYAFKAVKLSPGQNEVRMVFDNVYRRMASYTLVLIGAGFTLAILFGILKLILIHPVVLAKENEIIGV